MIRKAVASDLPAIRDCAVAAYVKYVDRIGRKPAPMVADFATAIDCGQVHVAVETAGLGGFVVFYARAVHVHLENVAVDPARQGRGIARRLIEFAETRAISLGFNRIELYTNARMTGNLEFYPRLGYREFDRRVEDGFDRVYFRKRLG